MKLVGHRSTRWFFRDVKFSSPCRESTGVQSSANIFGKSRWTFLKYKTMKWEIKRTHLGSKRSVKNDYFDTRMEVTLYRTGKMSWRPFWCMVQPPQPPLAPPPRTLMGRLINQDDGLYEQYNSCSHSSATLFGTFPWPQLNDFDVKNHEGTLTFYRRRDWTYDDNFSFLFLNLNRVCTRSIPGNSSMAMFEKKILYVSTKRALPYEA